MQAFEWAVVYPDFMDLTIPMAGSPQSTSYDKLLWTSEIDALRWTGKFDQFDGKTYEFVPTKQPATPFLTFTLAPGAVEVRGPAGPEILTINSK